jgi:hypothetical protein
MTNRNVVIVMARCTQSKQSFGIRLEEKISSQWVADWAFPIKESTATKEGYDKSEIAGSFLLDETYPGCPYCKRSNFCLCGGGLFSQCGKVGCSDGEDTIYICPWCSNKGKISGHIERLNAGNDR